MVNTDIRDQSNDSHVLGYITTDQDPHINCASEKGFLTLQCGHRLQMMTAACEHDQKRSKYLRSGKIGIHKVLAMRDSGCDDVVVKEEYVQHSEFTGKNKICTLIDGTTRTFPEAEINIDTPFYVGKVSATCMPKPVHDLIVGNVPGVKDSEELDNTPESREGIGLHNKLESKSEPPVDTDNVCSGKVARELHSQISFPNGKTGLNIGHSLTIRNLCLITSIVINLLLLETPTSGKLFSTSVDIVSEYAMSAILNILYFIISLVESVEAGDSRLRVVIFLGFMFIPVIIAR
jgi:hypothetical protein